MIALLLALNGGSNHDNNAGPALLSPSEHPAASTTATTSTTSAPASTQAATSPRPTPTRSRPATHVEAKRTSRPTAAVVPVSVLNNSTRGGLAHRAAAQVAAQGWPIAKVGNFTGRVAMSTLYYAPGQGASAERLAAQLPAIRRVLPRFSGLPTAGLTLVVTREWPA